MQPSIWLVRKTGPFKKYGCIFFHVQWRRDQSYEGWNDKQYHPTLIKNYSEHIDLVNAAGYKNLICFSGNRKGMDDETGLKNCVEGLEKILPWQKKKVLLSRWNC